ncbi:MAG: phage tail protein [Sphingomonas phyllosphaerae]|uniref:phage tail protein n=1 Tax=Sphingomonas phyllosphaerae TaxID=257003 RepID=UPI002FF83C6D
MATLVLTAVGNAVGGPVGGAVGAVLGQVIDRRVLGPALTRTRAGVRLTDLKVQTSAYGTPLPRIFGTMRVSGCVIWATDLIETRSVMRGGKGRPGVEGYRYAASFAVALSARPIAGIGRIWAEGKLLRGAAGDWKQPVTMRWYRGDEAQVADPLIAALEDHAPAYRGTAYAVFENLSLEAFGNRIPSLSFEVIGDAAPPTIGAVALALGGGAVAGAGPSATLPGYATGAESVAAALEMLATIAGGWWIPAGDTLRLSEAGGAPEAIPADAAIGEQRQTIETVPQRVRVSCYDPARDYQIGVQQAARPGGGWREEAQELPAALEAAQARGLAQAVLKRAERARVTRRVTLDASAIGIAPGAVVRCAGETATWRVTRAEVSGHGVTLSLAAPAEGSPALPADAGRVLAAPDLATAATVLVAAELPALDDGRGETLRIAVLANGDAPGWSGAALMTSDDDGATWEEAGSTAAPAIVGRLAMPVAAGTAWLIDRATTLEVMLAHDALTLMSIDDAALDRGGNLALLGEELIQFRDAEQIAPRRWRLSTVLRGRRGSVAQAQAAGVAFALVERGCVTTIALPRARPGDTIRLLASGRGDAAPVATSLVPTGLSIAPPAPVRLRATRRADGGADVRWVRRSRLGWRWGDDGDVPLGEERERYRMTIGTGAGARVIESDLPAVSVPAALMPAGQVRVEVRQLGTLAGSAATIGWIEGE